MPTAHFTDVELGCRHCGKINFHPGFLDELEKLRVAFGKPMRINSACRCKEHNDRPAAQGGAGGHSKSLHVLDFAQHPGQKGTLAVDVHCPQGIYRGQLFTLAWMRGWSIGWNGPHTFLHLDRRIMVGLMQTTFDY